ncbi:MAG: ATP-dependent DNA helicase RecG [Patescibacteria group bacterium]|nr:ATP-dependent DNA helicase RecG [Patescibacteria group bacterium]
MLTLESKISELSAVGPAYVKKLQKVGIENVMDLLFYFPFRYDDFSDVKKIGDVELGEVVSVKGKILDIQNIRTWKRKMNLTEAMIEDESGVMKAIWFNQPFMTRNLRSGINVSLSGKVVYAQEGLQISNPSYELLGSGQSMHTARLVPIYHETEGLSSKWLRAHIKPLMKLTKDVEEFLPNELIKNQKLFSLSEAISQIHFPDNEEKALKAKRRLAFDELFLVQLYMILQKKKWQENKAVKIKFDEKIEKEIKTFVKSLPFTLTNAQRTSSWSIIKDLQKNVSMNRLLEGDVGSGKTLVALISALAVIKSGFQVAFMAPTSILAGQHFSEAVKRFGCLDFKIALLTSSESLMLCNGKEKNINRGELLKKIKKGEINFLIGTHSLIQESVSFFNLAYSIVDEQHRFGIDQRAKLQNKVICIKDGLETVPHLLSMTATPIPRTLALTVYGDLDLSVLDEMPKDRKKIITKVVAPVNLNLAYRFIYDQIKKGRQAFVICPLIDESDVLEVKSAKQEYEKLSKKIYSKLKIGLLHGKLKQKEKTETMKKFVSGEIDILVSTSVIEVGVDIPNASVMLIEGADRFGLAQLHQFRGRVGRGKYQSFCFLFTDSTSATTARRLKALVKSDNGFQLAEQDLKIRGPGELVGVRQSGFPDLAMASLGDVELIKSTREEAIKLVDKDYKLKKFPKLVMKLRKFTKKVHFE